MLQGKNIRLRLVTVEDAEFILSLRLDENKGKYLSKVENDVEKQRSWIKNYQQREAQRQEFYFIIESFQGESLGTVRIYDLREDSFCWGSWLMKENSPFSAAIESILLIYQFGFYTLGFSRTDFDVRINNLKVAKFYKSLGSVETNQDEDNIYLTLSRQQYELVREKYKRFLLNSDEPKI